MWIGLQCFRVHKIYPEVVTVGVERGCIEPSCAREGGGLDGGCGDDEVCLFGFLTALVPVDFFGKGVNNNLSVDVMPDEETSFASGWASVGL